MIKFSNKSFKKKKRLWQRNKTSFKSRSSFLPRKRNSVQFFKKIIFIIFIFLIIYFLSFSQFFLIKKVEIEGNKNILSDSIREVVNNDTSQPIFGFIPGNNFFFSKDEKIKITLLNKFSEIKSVEVNKKFPNLLEIKIIERHPLIIWCRLDSCYYIDDNGTAFLSAEKKVFTKENRKFIKIIEQLEIEEELEDNFKIEEENIIENKNNVTYQLNSAQFEKIRLFFVGEEQNDWIMTYPDLFAIAGEDLGLPVLSKISGRFISYSLDFEKIIIDDLKRIEVSDDEKIYLIRINFDYENESILINVIEEGKKENNKNEIVFEPIKINDQVSDSDFINFAVSVDAKIKNSTALNINYYKTKGTRYRELIAYTDKNTRIYFNTTDSADSQVNHLKDFLSKGIDRKKIDTLKYIYLKSGNRIFYK